MTPPTSSQLRQQTTVNRIVAASELFGQAMVAAADRIKSKKGLLEAALDLGSRYAHKDVAQRDEYVQAVAALLREELTLPEGQPTKEELDATIGYLNIKNALPEFNPTMPSFKALVTGAANDFLSVSAELPVIRERVEAAKSTLRSAIVAGRFDTGKASVILINAIRGQSSDAGHSGPK